MTTADRAGVGSDGPGDRNAGGAMGRMAPGDLVSATAELHWAAQLVASAGQTFVEPAEDDSHRAMHWEAAQSAFVGAPFAGAYPFRVALRPADLALLILDRTGEAVATLPLAGVGIEDGYAWLSAAMATYFGGPPPVFERPDWELPAHPLEQGARFSSPVGAELEALSELYATADRLIAEVAEKLEHASPVRCWPHHLDIASLITLERDSDGAASRTLGIGMAPRGGGYDTWYWYVSPWPYPVPARLRALRRGHWHTDGWTGAVLAGEEVVAMPAHARLGAVRDFLEDAVEAALDALR
jgi:hypothetical protein